MKGQQRILRCQSRDCGLIRPCLPFDTSDGQQWLCIDCCPLEVPSADASGPDGRAIADGGDVDGE